MESGKLFLECADLENKDLIALRAFFQNEADAEGVAVEFLAIFEESAPPDTIPEIHASASHIFMLAVHIVEGVGGVAGAITSIGKAYDWIQERVKKYNEKRDAEYDLKPFYDASENVYKMMKVPKTRD